MPGVSLRELTVLVEHYSSVSETYNYCVVFQVEIPAINKLKKHLNKATLDMDSLKSR